MKVNGYGIASFDSVWIFTEQLARATFFPCTSCSLLSVNIGDCYRPAWAFRSLTDANWILFQRIPIMISITFFLSHFGPFFSSNFSHAVYGLIQINDMNAHFCCCCHFENFMNSFIDQIDFWFAADYFRLVLLLSLWCRLLSMLFSTSISLVGYLFRQKRLQAEYRSDGFRFTLGIILH